MDNPYVLMHTSEGDMLIELFPDKAPKTVGNFLAYLDSGHYDETLFHRVVRGFVIQGGGYARSLEKKPVGAPIPNEAGNGLKNLHGTVAMARAPEPHSATDEFFINAKDNPDLDHADDTDEGFGYAVFGQVAEGLDVLKKINWKVTKPRDDFPDLPTDPIVIITMTRFE